MSVIPVTSTCVGRINSYAKRFKAKTYLEIGVHKGNTFVNIEMPHKTAVDPEFLFDIEEFKNDTTIFYREPSNTFFELFKNDSKAGPYGSQDEKFAFDIMFIDGLHTFEQTLRDFENSIPYSHDETIWLFDDTCPSHAFSAIPCQEKSNLWRAVAGMSLDGSWHGDVFKVIFAIHDKYPEYSYCTQIDNGNPQTILWKTKEKTQRKKLFPSLDVISAMRYEDFIEHSFVLHPVKDEEVMDKIYSNIDPVQYRTGEEYKLVIKKIVTDHEKMYALENRRLNAWIMRKRKER